ncbi:DUF3151 family protein [Rhodococcus hoagii]|nr:DUF3151 family protein [Prescottella equi]
MDSYAYARVGYHRGLDALAPGGVARRRPGAVRPQPTAASCAPCTRWARGAGIGESEEVERIRTFLRDSDPPAAEEIEADQGRAQG